MIQEATEASETWPGNGLQPHIDAAREWQLRQQAVASTLVYAVVVVDASWKTRATLTDGVLIVGLFMSSCTTRLSRTTFVRCSAVLVQHSHINSFSDMPSS